LDLPRRINVYGKVYIDEPELDSDIVIISGCADPQTSSDTYINRQYCGALTWAFMDTLKEVYNGVQTPRGNGDKDTLLIKRKGLITWDNFIILIAHKLLSNGYEQQAQLSFCIRGQQKDRIDY